MTNRHCLSKAFLIPMREVALYPSISIPLVKYRYSLETKLTPLWLLLRARYLHILPGPSKWIFGSFKPRIKTALGLPFLLLQYLDNDTYHKLDTHN